MITIPSILRGLIGVERVMGYRGWEGLWRMWFFGTEPDEAITPWRFI